MGSGSRRTFEQSEQRTALGMRFRDRAAQRAAGIKLESISAQVDEPVFERRVLLEHELR